MILVLKEADFSVNNIGQIEVPIYISSRIERMLSNYSKAFTDIQKKAVQDFLQGLNDSGLYSKIGRLFLPILAGEVGEVFYDIITGAVYEASNQNYQLETNGVVGISSSDGAGTLVNDYTYNLKNFHILAYNTETMQSHMTGGQLSNKITLNNGMERYSKSVYNKEAKCETALRNTANTGVSYVLNSAERGTACTGKALLGLAVKNGVAAYWYPNVYTNKNYTDILDANINRTYILPITAGVPFGLLSIGVGLTKTEVISYGELVGDLMSAFGV